MAWRLPVHGFSNYSCLSSREHCQPQFQWSGEKTPHTLTFRLPLAWPRLWYTRWDLGRVVWGSSNNSEKSRHFSSKMSILNAVRTGGKNDWENWGICRVEVNFHTKTYNNRSFLFFFFTINVKQSSVFLTAESFWDTCSCLSLSCTSYIQRQQWFCLQEALFWANSWVEWLAFV